MQRIRSSPRYRANLHSEDRELVHCFGSERRGCVPVWWQLMLFSVTGGRVLLLAVLLVKSCAFHTRFDCGSSSSSPCTGSHARGVIRWTGWQTPYNVQAKASYRSDSPLALASTNGAFMHCWNLYNERAATPKIGYPYKMWAYRCMNHTRLLKVGVNDRDKRERWGARHFYIS